MRSQPWPRGHRITVAVDDPSNARALSRAEVAAASSLGVLIEVDVGMGRAEVRTSGQAVELALAVDELPALELRGVQGYEGHCMVEDWPVSPRGSGPVAFV